MIEMPALAIFDKGGASTRKAIDKLVLDPSSTIAEQMRVKVRRISLIDELFMEKSFEVIVLSSELALLLPAMLPLLTLQLASLVNDPTVVSAQQDLFALGQVTYDSVSEAWRTAVTGDQTPVHNSTLSPMSFEADAAAKGESFERKPPRSEVLGANDYDTTAD